MANESKGLVIGRTALTGATKLKRLDETRRLGLLIEAANALRVPPSEVERRLAKGENIMYRDPEKLK